MALRFSALGGCHTRAEVQTLIRHVDQKMLPQDAIEAPRARLWKGRLAPAEGRLDPDVLAGLRARGHDVVAIEDFSPTMRRHAGDRRRSRDGAMIWAADPRRDGYMVAPSRGGPSLRQVGVARERYRPGAGRRRLSYLRFHDECFIAAMM